MWQEDACLVYSRGDCCNFQDLPEVINSEVADTNAPVEMDVLDTGEINLEEFWYVVSPSF